MLRKLHHPAPTEAARQPETPSAQQPAMDEISETTEQERTEQERTEQERTEPDHTMDNTSPNLPQTALQPRQIEGAPELPPPPPPGRRKRTFPVTFLVGQDAKGRTVESRMFYAHEWAEYQAAKQAAERARNEAEDAARAAREAEHAAGRPATDSQNGPAPEAALNPISSSVPDFERHSRLCSVCSHPDRDAIEGDFVRWRSPRDIAGDYGLSDRTAIYRHAHATGLFRRRKGELGRVMEKYLENADYVPPLEFDIVTRAVRAYSHLDDDGRWFEPPRVNYIFAGPATPQSPLPEPSSIEVQFRPRKESNR
ncbi:MAG TPA: hypothetical protein VKS44_16360 [Candidatus Acidoferrales bacterium]|nr:hypothetical protein [Candidatus Acidoferrales bacterium]